MVELADIATQSPAPAPPPAAVLPLVLSDVSYGVGERRLIDRVSARLDAGSRTVILGPNGAGKSLLLRLCHGLIEPTAGTIMWAGVSPRLARARQAMVFQRPVLLRRSAARNVTYALGIKGIRRRDRAAMAAAALAQAGLTRLADQPARVLSGGEQQRLAIARAFALRPQVLLLDEPTANLDIAATAAVEDLIRAIHAAGTKIVMTTHDLGQARRLADDVLFLHRGRLVEHTRAGEFFARPRSVEAAAFIEGRLLW